MSDIQIGFAGIGILLTLILLRVPISVALIGVSFGGLWKLMGWKVAWGSLGVIPYQFAANWILSSVPMFLLLGFICFHAGLTQGLFRAARLWLSALPGGLAIAAIFGSAGFAAVSGSSVACSAAMGRMAIPEMLRYGYHPQLATGTVAVAGTIGALIPPSILMILYGVIAEVPITSLFIGGLAAGAFTVVAYVAVVMIRVKLNPELAPSSPEPPTWPERIAALKDTWPVILIFIGVFGGLFGGIFTATEAGAIGAFLATLVAIIKRSMNWNIFKNAILETLLTTGTVLIIAVGASLLTRFLVLSGAGEAISQAVVGMQAGTVTLMLGIVLVYLALGMFLEPVGAMLLTLPILLPVLDQGGFNLIWFGVVLTKLLEIGMVTPPVGMNVFVIKGVVGKLVSTGAIFRGVIWFIAVDLLLVFLFMLFPELILYLPSLRS